jgi:hypothetical protein
LAGYEQIFVADELSESVQRARIAPGRHETLGELVRDIAARRGARWAEDLISREPTRHEVRVESEGRNHYAG